MKLIESKAEYLPQAIVPSASPEGILEGIYKQIELAGRTCYKSLDKVTDSSAKPFVDRMISSKHTAMLEHGTVYLKTYRNFEFEHNIELTEYSNSLEKYSINNYSKYTEDSNYAYVVTNYRVLVENNWLDDLQYLCNPTEHHEKRYTFKLTTSIGVTRELNRHRVNSIAEQSTRYCNYSKDKFNNEVTFCKPVWAPDYDETDWDRFLKALWDAENAYLGLINQGWQPQQAREILPLCTASEIVHTAFASDWRFFFDLRLFGKTGAPHPNMLHLAKLMKAEAEKQGIWEDIMKYPSKFE